MNLKRSLQLYKILEPYLPEDLELEPFDFISIIVHNIKESENYKAYLDAIEFISGMPRVELIRMGTMELFELFAEGLTEVQIISLTKYCRDMGLNNA